MEMFEAMAARRSIRAYTEDTVSREQIERILQAAALAPSAKNRQPWHFVVVGEEERPAMAEAMRAGLEGREQTAVSEAEKQMLQGARHTLSIMERAPVTVFILNEYGKSPAEALAPYGERFMEMANLQSVGAAIEHMCLAATAMGLGSLWICDVFDAYHTLTPWLGAEGQLVAAVSIGYPAEAPGPRPRKALADMITWR